MKGLSLEIPIGLADVVICTESNIIIIVKRDYSDAPGSETIACYTLIQQSTWEILKLLRRGEGVVKR